MSHRAAATALLALAAVASAATQVGESQTRVEAAYAIAKPWPDAPPPEPSAPTTTTVPPTTTTTVVPPPITTTTTSVPVPPAGETSAKPSGDCAGWEVTVAAYFPTDQVGTACSVMMCETGGTGDPTVHNPRSTASGLWQFLDSTWESTTGTPAPAASYGANVQTAAAAKLWRQSGWAPWSCA